MGRTGYLFSILWLAGLGTATAAETCTMTINFKNVFPDTPRGGYFIGVDFDRSSVKHLLSTYLPMKQKGMVWSNALRDGQGQTTSKRLKFTGKCWVARSFKLRTCYKDVDTKGKGRCSKAVVGGVRRHTHGQWILNVNLRENERGRAEIETSMRTDPRNEAHVPKSGPCHLRLKVKYRGDNDRVDFALDPGRSHVRTQAAPWKPLVKKNRKDPWLIRNLTIERGRTAVLDYFFESRSPSTCASKRMFKLQVCVADTTRSNLPTCELIGKKVNGRKANPVAGPWAYHIEIGKHPSGRQFKLKSVRKIKK